MTLVSHEPRPCSSRAKPAFEILPAKREQMAIIADFVRSSAGWYRPIVDEKDMAEHDPSKLWEEVNFAKRDFHVAYAHGVPVGTISLQYFGNYAYVGYVYLHVDHVGKGYGQRLLRFAADAARRRKMKGLALIAHPQATWAKRAYLKFGFKIAERTKRGVLAWQHGVLRSYYEEGFELYVFDFEEEESNHQELS